MKTKNYKFELMYQGQDHKDVIYNESVLKLDANLNMSVLNFVETTPRSISYGERFILSSGVNRNKICYYAHPDKGPEYLQPHNNMLVYLVNEDCFARFSTKEDMWQKINPGSASGAAAPSTTITFTGISGDFRLSVDREYHYLYLNNKAHIMLEDVRKPEITVVIKQNERTVYDIRWSTNVLWLEQRAGRAPTRVNTIDLFRFYKLPETEHFLAETIGKNYQY